ncbi:hypothetical protein, partial [Thalassospira alkalitolerans]|uniref:hypothetical protein n=1 Tax=Thalassospira alkalitolerans TaxID=1293890 RepID=UPI003AA85DA2
FTDPIEPAGHNCRKLSTRSVPTSDQKSGEKRSGRSSRISREITVDYALKFSCVPRPKMSCWDNLQKGTFFFLGKMHFALLKTRKS